MKIQVLIIITKKYNKKLNNRLLLAIVENPVLIIVTKKYSEEMYNKLLLIKVEDPDIDNNY